MAPPRRDSSQPSSSGKMKAKKDKPSKPDSRDWTKESYMHPVVNQEKTSHCSIFVAVAAVESLFMLKNNQERIKLSEQEIVDNYFFYFEASKDNKECQYGSNNGCFRYIKEYGISRAEHWPYTGERAANLKGPRSKPSPQTSIAITDYVNVFGGEEYVIEALDKQPLVGAMYVTKELINLKRGEIYNGGSPITKYMHAVFLVGYGVDSKKKKFFYKIKGSWGTSWGDDGYGRVERSSISRISYPVGIKPYANNIN